VPQLSQGNPIGWLNCCHHVRAMKGATKMKRALRWSMSALMLALVAAASFFFWHATAQLDALASPTVNTLSSTLQTVPPATPVSAVGSIELVSKRQIVLLTNGTVAEVAVEVGDSVSAGDLLIALDTQHLEWAVEQADLALEQAQLALEQASESIEPSDIALAEAKLLSAQEQLALVEAGPTKEQLDAARANAAAAWATYNELQAGPSPEELTQASASLKQAEIDLQQAQREYDRIAWQPDAGASSQGAALQRASIVYEAAKAAYDQLVKPARTSALQGAVAAAHQAQNTLNELLKKPTPAELAAAQAAVAEAEAELAKLKKGNEAAAIRNAELNVQSAQIALEQAKLNLSNARVVSPVNGVVLEVNVEVGQQGSNGTVVATVADVSRLRAIVNVEQIDIGQIQIGQAAEVSVYGLPDVVYHGVVEKIAPQGNTATGSIAFPVVIRLTDDSVADLKPGMSATASFVAGEPVEESEEAAADEASDDAAEDEETADGETVDDETE
jgi:HlyD family secretion protein